MADRPLAGRVALVTGASRGIGRGIALALAQAGAHVAINYRCNAAAARETAAEAEAFEVQALPVQADVSVEGQVQQMVRTVVETLGPVDLLVNNAGIPSAGRTVAETEPAELRQLLDVHLFGSFHCTQSVLPIMRECPRGDIIFISSDAAVRCKAGSAPYSIAKAALEALARTLAKEERASGIRVNIVAPGLTDTDMAREVLRRRGVTDPAQIASESPFGRLARPIEVGHLCVYLASESGSYITGQVIRVDGGGA